MKKLLILIICLFLVGCFYYDPYAYKNDNPKGPDIRESENNWPTYKSRNIEKLEKQEKINIKNSLNP